MEWIKNNRIVYFSLLYCLTGHLLVACYTYSNMLFLGHYPASWLAFYYAVLGLMGLVVLPFLFKFVSHLLFLPLRFLWLITSFIITVFAYFSLNHFNLSYMFNSLLIVLVFHYCALLKDSCAEKAKDITGFKKYTHIMLASFSIGAVMSGFMISLMLSHHLANAMEYFIVALLLLHTTMVMVVRNHIAVGQETVTQNPTEIPLKSVLNRKLIVLTFFFGIILLTATFLLEFGLKNVLSLRYSANQIGNFISTMYAVINGLTFYFQIFIAPRVLKRTGLIVFVGIYAVVFIICALLLFTQFSLLVLISCNVLMFTAKYSFYDSGSRLFFSVLPDKLKHIGTVFLSAYLMPVAMLLSSAVMYLIHLQSPMYLNMSILSCGIAAMIVLAFIHFNYRKELLDALKQHRCQASHEETLASNLTTTFVDLGLASGEVKQALVALDMMDKEKELLTIERVKKCLELNDDLVKERIFSILSRVEDIEFLHLVKTNLSSRDMEVVKWYGFFYLLPFVNDFAELQSLVNMDDQTKQKIMRLGWDKTHLDKEENIEDLITGVISHSNPEVRLCLLKLCEYINLNTGPKLISDILNTSDTSSRLKAVSLIPKYPEPRLVEGAMDVISTPQLSKVIIDNLASVENLKISILHKYLKQYAHTLRQRRMVVHLSSHLKNSEAQVLMLSFSNQSDFLLRSNIAKYFTEHVMSFGLDSVSKPILKTKIVEEISYYNKLLYIKGHIEETNRSESLKVEVDFKIKRTMLRSLYWIQSYLQLEALTPLTHHLDRVLKPKSKLRGDLLPKINQRLQLFPNYQYAIKCFFDGKPIDCEELVSDTDTLYEQDNVIQLLLKPITEDDMKTADELLLFRQFPLFNDLPIEVIQVISEDFQVVNAASGEVLFNQGDVGDGFYLLADGEIDLLRDGELKVTLTKGKYFGELASIDEEPRTMSAVCKTDCSLFYIDRNSFEKLCDEVPEVTRAFMKQLLMYYRQALASAT